MPIALLERPFKIISGSHKLTMIFQFGNWQNLHRCALYFSFFFEPWLALALPISMKMKILNLKKASFYCHDIPRRRQRYHSHPSCLTRVW